MPDRLRHSLQLDLGAVRDWLDALADRLFPRPVPVPVPVRREPDGRAPEPGRNPRTS